LFARGTINAAALISLIEGGVLAKLPDLKVILTTLAFGGLFLSAAFATGERDATTRLLRRQVFVDTMGLHPTLIRASVDMLGADNVLLGTDWPIVSDGPIQARVERAFAEAGLTQAEQRAIAGGNARRLFHASGRG
jgi:predicted TIM-barrel fold metal-dependent hydrolase